MIRFDPTQERYQSPSGAVRTDQEILLSIEVGNELKVDGIDLILRRDGIDQLVTHHLIKSDIFEDVTEYKLTFCVQEVGLYFYRFELHQGEKILFCGKNDDGTALIADWLPEWQLTVYDKRFKTPAWFGEGVVYQIFVDRFAQGTPCDLTGINKDYILREDWGGTPQYERAPNGDMKTNDFFGGNLDGIRGKLEYLAGLGVTCLYLCPIFEAYSNHKYDTADYMKIDPMFGTLEDFQALCAQAAEKGIRILLDGVFSHTGSDSVYFNKAGHYGDGGAYRSKQSPYYSWYNFQNWPDSYECWWGIKILPNVREEDPSYLEFITGQEGVLRYWLKNGASGWRLDVADELPDVFLDSLRSAVKAEKADAVVIGEVWEDAVTKESYGKRRRYLLGHQLDSVMNYPFRQAILDFVKGGQAHCFADAVLGIVNHYPLPAINCLMNMIGTHDTMRCLTELSVINKDTLSRQQRADYKLSEQDYQQAKKRLMLASVLQFTLPGVPCIYYGDEAGMEGYEDPFNRRCYPWGQEDQELLAWYQWLGQMRKDQQIPLAGTIRIITAKDHVVVYSRGEKLIVAVNAGEKDADISIPDGAYSNLLTGEDVRCSVRVAGCSFMILR